MAIPKIVLDIQNGRITATAVDQNGNTIPNGDLTLNPSGVIHWSHAAQAEELKQFVVRFLESGNEGWPFQAPPEPTDNSKRLRIRHGKRRVTRLANVTNLTWTYKVSMSGYADLDPMIIIRGNVVKPSKVAVVLAVIGGLVVAALLGWWFLRAS
jgi:hypothetical protein